jgi:hypothetical protein
MFLFLSLLLLGDAFVIDELHAQSLGTFASRESITVFVGISGLNIKVHWYDLQTEKGKTLDPNKTRAIFPRVIASSDGFLLVETMGRAKMIHVTPKGEYQSTQYLQDFEGWDENLVFKEPAGFEGRLIGNFETLDGRKILVCEIFTEERRIEPIHEHIQGEDIRVRFYPWKNGYLFLNKHTGLLQQRSADFEKTHILRPASNPLRVKPGSPLSRRMTYFGMIWVKSLTKDHVIFAFNKPDPFDDNKYQSFSHHGLALADGRLNESEAYILGEYGGKRLLYFFNDQEFKLEKQSP